MSAGWTFARLRSGSSARLCIGSSFRDEARRSVCGTGLEDGWTRGARRCTARCAPTFIPAMPRQGRLGGSPRGRGGAAGGNSNAPRGEARTGRTGDGRGRRPAQGSIAAATIAGAASRIAARSIRSSRITRETRVCPDRGSSRNPPADGSSSTASSNRPVDSGQQLGTRVTARPKTIERHGRGS